MKETFYYRDDKPPSRNIRKLLKEENALVKEISKTPDAIADFETDFNNEFSWLSTVVIRRDFLLFRISKMKEWLKHGKI